MTTGCVLGASGHTGSRTWARMLFITCLRYASTSSKEPIPISAFTQVLCACNTWRVPFPWCKWLEIPLGSTRETSLYTCHSVLDFFFFWKVSLSFSKWIPDVKSSFFLKAEQEIMTFIGWLTQFPNHLILICFVSKNHAVCYCLLFYLRSS